MGTQPAPNKSPAASDVGVGQLLFDEYSVERLLGEGGYGAVHLVASQVTGEQFALKRALLEDDAGRSELLAEVKAWMNVPRYPHIVACRFFRVSGEAVYIFAAYVDGGSLEDSRRTGRLYQGDPRAVLARVLELAVESAWGLHAAHQAGLIHQDVKPSNIFVTADWVAKVADFGLTEKRRPDPVSEALLEYVIQDTKEEGVRERMRGILRGQFKADDQQEVQGRGAFTASHASPEQLGGSLLTRGTDVWSWGVTLLDLFNGKCTWELGTDAPAALSEIAANGPAVAGLPRLPRRRRNRALLPGGPGPALAIPGGSRGRTDGRLPGDPSTPLPTGHAPDGRSHHYDPHAAIAFGIGMDGSASMAGSGL